MSKCKHGATLCDTCNREMMEDFVLNNLDVLNSWEIAQAVREGITTLAKVERKLTGQLPPNGHTTH